jgi:hypothetical protein
LLALELLEGELGTKLVSKVELSKEFLILIASEEANSLGGLRIVSLAQGLGSMKSTHSFADFF